RFLLLTVDSACCCRESRIRLSAAQSARVRPRAPVLACSQESCCRRPCSALGAAHVQRNSLGVVSFRAPETRPRGDLAMHKYCRRGLPDAQLDRGLDRLLLAERPHNAEVLSYIAEIGARGLFREAGYSTVYAYLMGRWHLSESAAHKRARSARAAREFPVL